MRLNLTGPNSTTHLRRRVLMLTGNNYFDDDLFPVFMRGLLFFVQFLFTDHFLLLFSRRGNCKNVAMGMECEIGLRRRTYNVLAGCVLSVWTKVEDLLNTRTGQNNKMQVVRLRSSDGLKIVGEYQLN